MYQTSLLPTWYSPLLYFYSSMYLSLPMIVPFFSPPSLVVQLFLRTLYLCICISTLVCIFRSQLLYHSHSLVQLFLRHDADPAMSDEEPPRPRPSLLSQVHLEREPLARVRGVRPHQVDPAHRARLCRTTQYLVN